MADHTRALRAALERLLDCTERLDPDGRGRDNQTTDEEIDAAMDEARRVLDRTKQPELDPQRLVHRPIG